MWKIILMAILTGLFTCIVDTVYAKKITLNIPTVETTNEVRISNLDINWDSKTAVITYSLGYESDGVFIKTGRGRILKQNDIDTPTGFNDFVTSIKNTMEDILLTEVMATHAGTIE